MQTYYGLYRGIITDNKDAAKAGRAQVTLPALGTAPLVNWAVPRNSYMIGLSQGQMIIPEIGTKVWIEFENGNINYPVYSLASWLGHDCYNGLEDVETEQIYEEDSPISKYMFRSKNLFVRLNERDGNVEFVRQDIDETSTWWQKVKRYISVVLNKDFLEIKKFNETSSSFQGYEEPTLLGKISLTNNAFSVDMFNDNGEPFGKVILTPQGIELKFSVNGEEKSKILLNAEGVKIVSQAKVTVEANSEVAVNAPNVNISAQTKINGAGTGMPGFCKLPVCAFTGAVHTTDTVGMS